MEASEPLPPPPKLKNPKYELGQKFWGKSCRRAVCPGGGAAPRPSRGGLIPRRLVAATLGHHGRAPCPVLGAGTSGTAAAPGSSPPLPRLIGGLASENVRWAESVEVLREQEKTLCGDVLLVSAFVSYVGYFTKKYRAELLEKHWVPFLSGLAVSGQGSHPGVPGAPSPHARQLRGAPAPPWAGTQRPLPGRSPSPSPRGWTPSASSPIPLTWLPGATRGCPATARPSRMPPSSATPSGGP